MAANRARRNAVRFYISADFTMDALQFSRMIIQDELGFRPTHLDFVFSYPGGKKFEVIFTTFLMFEQCIQRFEAKKDSEPLKHFMMTSLTEPEKRWVNITMYNEFVQPWDKKTWLQQYCIVIHGDRVRDADGVKTGLFKAQVSLRKNKDTGELQHIPSCIRLGAAQGNVFYMGQPKKCRKCEGMGHLARDCKEMFCNNCQQPGHEARECTSVKSCNLCGSNEHVFKDCPKSYASKTRTEKAESLFRFNAMKDKTAREEEARLREEERLAEEAFVNSMLTGEEGEGAYDNAESSPEMNGTDTVTPAPQETSHEHPVGYTPNLEEIGSKISEFREGGTPKPAPAPTVVVTKNVEKAQEEGNKEQNGASASLPRGQPPDKDPAGDLAAEELQRAAGGGAKEQFAYGGLSDNKAAGTEGKKGATEEKPLGQEEAPWPDVPKKKDPPLKKKETLIASAPQPKPRRGKTPSVAAGEEAKKSGKEGKSSQQVGLGNRYQILTEQNLSETPDLIQSSEDLENSQPLKQRYRKDAHSLGKNGNMETMQESLDSIDHACKKMELSRRENREKEDSRMEWGDCHGQEEEEAAGMDFSTTRKREGSNTEEDSDDSSTENKGHKAQRRQLLSDPLGASLNLTPDSRQDKKKMKCKK